MNKHRNDYGSMGIGLWVVLAIYMLFSRARSWRHALRSIKWVR